MLEQSRRRGHRIPRLGIAAVGFALSIVVINPSDAVAQWTYQVGEAPSTGEPNPIFSVQSPLTCSSGGQILPDGGYLKRVPAPNGAPVRIDTVTENTGTCRASWNNNLYSTDPHGINYIV